MKNRKRLKQSRQKAGLMPAIREANGRERRPTTRSARAECITAVVKAQPHRRGNDTQLAGFALGRLYLTKQIDRDQFAAGEKYTTLAIRHMRDISGTLPRFPSVMADNTASGLSTSPDMDDDQIFALRRDWEDAMRALNDAGDLHNAVRALTGVCVMDRDIDTVPELGTLRTSLNVLHRLWR